LSLLKGHIGLCPVVHTTAILWETSFHHLQEPMDINILKTYFMKTAHVCQKLTSLPIHILLYITETFMSEKSIHNLTKSHSIIVYTVLPALTSFLKRSAKINLKSMLYEGTVKLRFIFQIHFAIFIPNNYFIVFQLQRSQMFIFRATWVCIILC
jgi:hypothetical protein